MYVFGFGYDSTFLKSTGARAWDGLRYAEDQLRRDAAAQGLTLTQHRRQLQRKYRDMVGALHSQSASKDRSNETD
jgi:hypothetical protein